MHLMLQLNSYQVGDAIVEDKNHRWEAVSWVYSDQPQMVRDYFNNLGIDFKPYLSNNQRKKIMQEQSYLPRLEMTTEERNKFKRKKRFEKSFTTTVQKDNTILPLKQKSSKEKNAPTSLGFIFPFKSAYTKPEPEKRSDHVSESMVT